MMQWLTPLSPHPDALIRNDSPAICRNQPRSRIVSDRASDFRVNYFGESTLPFQVLVTEQHFRCLSIQWYARTDRQVRTPSRWNSANQRSPVPCRQSSLQSLNRHPLFRHCQTRRLQVLVCLPLPRLKRNRGFLARFIAHYAMSVSPDAMRQLLEEL
jgi:hypothetical protein